MPRIIGAEEVSKHSTLEDLWIVVDETVYDLTGFEHPGGADGLSSSILCVAPPNNII